jgi:hypothetical protein|tara:strand:- start:9449 stop:9916 length:468 start_codon:yes stop_codon:yes gene_type:complete
MKLLLITLGIFIAPISAVAVDITGNYAVWGIGTKSCYAFNLVTVNYLNSDNSTQKKDESLISKLKFWEDKKNNEDEVENFDAYRNYIKGFLTAYNIFTEKTFSITGSMKEKQIVEWLNNYCKEEPMSTVENALTSFTFEHYDNRLKTSSRTRRGR